MTNEELFTNFKQYVDASMSQRTAHLATKDDIDSVEQRLGARIDGVEQRLGARIDGVEERIDNVEQRLTARIDGLDEKLDQALDAIGDTVTHVADGAETAVREHEERYHGRLKHRAA